MWRAILAGGGAFAADRALKIMAREGDLPHDPPGGLLHFSRLENTGLAGGVCSDSKELSRDLPCLAFALTAPALLANFGKKSRAEQIGTALLLGGSVGNVYDRVRRGTVTDMLQFPKAPGRLKHLVFNPADFAILIGGAVTAGATLWNHIKKEG